MMNSKVTQAVQAIYDLETMDDLYHIYDAIKLKQTQLQKQVTRKLTKGTPVKFTSRKEGQVIQGVLTKVNRKTVEVAVMGAFGRVNYKVPAEMIEEV